MQRLGFETLLREYNKPKSADYLFMKFYKGQIPWNKGLTEETDNRVKKYVDKQRGQKRPSITGDKNSSKRPEVRKKLRENNPMHKKESREKVRITKIEFWKDPINRENQSKRLKKTVLAKIEKLGYYISPIGRKKMSKSKIRLYKEHPEKRQRAREKTINQLSSGKMPNKETSIEKEIERELKKRKIKYRKQEALCKISVVDFYLPELKTVIYCDGDYWHRLPGCKEKDERQNKVLKDEGYKVFRFWESEIHKSSKNCIDKIINR